VSAAPATERSAAGPIGVFDSGVGGLTVARALLREAPNESLQYYGDFAYVPYGPRPLSQIKQFALDISTFLVGQGAKMIVMGCNMSSAVAVDAVRDRLGVSALGTVRAGARAAAATTRNGHIGVIATEGTVQAHVYARALDDLEPSLRVQELACPEFVPIVEAGPTGPDEQRVIRERLAPLGESPIDTLILGCTHYPLIADEIAASLQPGIALVDPAEELAREAVELLDGMGLRRNSPPPAHQFWASGDPQRLREMAPLLLRVRADQVGIVDVHTRNA
jgi:glutamate racemase